MFSEKLRKVIVVVVIIATTISSKGVMTFSAAISGMVENTVNKNSENEKDLKSYYYLQSMTRRTVKYMDDDSEELSDDAIIGVYSKDEESKDSSSDSFDEKNGDNFTPNHIENFDEDEETSEDTKYEDEPEEDEAYRVVEDIIVSSKSDADDDSSNDNEDSDDVDEDSFKEEKEENIATDSEIEKEEDTATDSEAEKEGNKATDSEAEVATDSNLSVEVATKSDLTKATVSIVTDGSKWYVVDILVATESTLNIKADMSVLDAINMRAIKEADVLITDGAGNYKTIKSPITWTSKIDEIRKNAKEKKEQESKELVKEKKMEKTVSARRLFTKALLEDNNDKNSDNVVEVVEIDDSIIKNFKDNVPKEYIISYPSSVAKEEDEIEIKERKRREWTKVVYDKEEMVDTDEIEVEDDDLVSMRNRFVDLTKSNVEEGEEEEVGEIEATKEEIEEETNEVEVIKERKLVLRDDLLIDEEANINIAYDKAYDFYGNYIGLLTREITKLYDDNLNRIYSKDIDVKNDSLYTESGNYLSNISSIDTDIVLSDEKEDMIYRDMLVKNAQRKESERRILKKQEETVIDTTLDIDDEIYIIDKETFSKALLSENIVLGNIEIPEIVVNYENTHKHKVCGVSGECEHTLFNHKEREEIEYKGGIVNSSGAYYLTKDTTYDGILSGDLYICLNGYEFNFEGDDNGYNIYITDCGEGTSRVDLYGSTLTQKIYILGTSKNTIELVESDNANCDKSIFNVKCILKEEKDIEGYTNIDDIEEIEIDDEIENVMSNEVKADTSFQEITWENTDIEGTYSQENKHYIIKSATFKNNYNKNAEDVFRGSNITVASGTFYIVECTSKDDLIQLGYPDGQANGNRTNFFKIESGASVSVLVANLGGEVDQSSALIEINPYSSLYVYGGLSMYSPGHKWNGKGVKNARIYVKENGKIVVREYSSIHFNASYNEAQNDSIYGIYMEKERSIISEKAGKLEFSVFNVYLDSLTGVFFENWDPSHDFDSNGAHIALHKSYAGLGATITRDVDNKTLAIVGSTKHSHKVCGIVGNCNHLRTDDHWDEIAYYLYGYDISKTSGKYVLKENTTISKDTTLTGDLYLCLDGFNLTMTGRIIGNGNNKIVICDCKAKGKITTTNYKYELFKNVKLELYGSSKEKPMTVEGYRIYYADKSTYVRVFNVKFIGKNEFGAGDSPIFVINNLNEYTNTIFSNCTFNTFKAKSLIQVKGRIDFYGINNIKDNEFTNYVIYNESEKFVGLQGGATVNIESNIIKSDIENTAILNFISGESGLIIDGTLNITNNTFATGKVTPKRQAAIYIPKGAYIYTIINKLKVLDNKSNNNIHAYQVYSERADGFMRSYPNETFIKQLNTDYSRFKVYINSPNGQGIVYKDWTVKTVQDVNKYNACVLLDEHYGDWAKLELANNNINIKLTHTHQICAGSVECSNLHHGHSNVSKGFSGLFNHNVSGSWLLSDNYVLTKDIAVEGSLNLCLNGKTLDMGSYKFYAEYLSCTLNICDCKGTGKIKTTSNKAELFKNLNVGLYGISKDKLLTIEGNRIYYGDSKTPYYDDGKTPYDDSKQSYFKSYNVQFLGNNASGANNDPIFVLNIGGAIAEFYNCNFSSFKAKSLIQTKTQINFYGTNNIQSNEFTNCVMNYESGHIMMLKKGATVHIEKNTIKSAIANTSIINFDNASKLFIDTNAILNIINNTFATGTITPQRQTAIYISKDAYINVNSKLKVLDNKSDNKKIHAYQIYSERSDWFIIATASKMNTDYSRFKVYINSPDGQGIVFKDWNDNTVQDKNKYNTCIIPDDKYNNMMEAVLRGTNVEIMSHHRHKLCGATNECNSDHQGHNSIVSYLGVETISATEGKYYLTKNSTLTKDITLTGDLCLCLNGRTLDMSSYRFFGSDNNKLIICDCVGDAKITTTKNKYELFKDVKMNIWGKNGSKPLTVEGYRIYYTESDNYIKASYINFVGKNDFGEGNDPIFVFGTGEDELVFSYCNFSKFKAKSLIKSKAPVAFYFSINIEENEFINHGLDIDVKTGDSDIQGVGDEAVVTDTHISRALIVYKESRVNIQDNIIKSNEESGSVINLNEGSGLVLDTQSTLEVLDNTFDTTKLSVLQSGIYISKNSMITVNEQACMRVYNNKSTNDVPVYQIFSDKTDGFINQGFNLVRASKLKIFMNTVEGQIFVDSESSKKGLDYYKYLILNDDNYVGTLALSNNNIVLKASHVGHKRCGTAKDKKCSDHTGIGNHKELYNLGIMPRGLPKQGGYFLMGNKVLDGHIVLEGDMALCLNGFTLDFQRFKIMGNEKYKLTICDCRGGGKIVGSGTLFGGINGQFELYGNSNRKMKIETQRIYQSDSQYTGENYIKAINIDFEHRGEGEEAYSTIWLSSSNNDSLFNNCTFSGFKSPHLMSANANLTFYGVNEIKNNEVSKDIIHMLTNHNLVVKEGATLNIENNVVKADVAEIAIINFDDVNVLSIEKNAALNVINNTFVEGIVTPTRQTAMYIPKNASIKLNSKMKVINNKSKNGFRAYQIYSNNGDGFITKDSKATIDTSNTRFMVYIATGKTIFKGWGSSNEYYNCILLDDMYGTGCELELSKSNVVLKITHENHSICGSTDKCNDRHKGEDHSKKFTYDLYTDYQKQGKYFLINDTELISDMTLEGDLYLCLNGYTLNMNAYRIIGNKYKLCICDCVGCGEIVAAENTRRYELFTNVNLEIYGHKYRPINVEGYRIYYAEKNTYIKAFGINFIGKNDFGYKEDEIFHIYGNNSNSLFSNCSFSDFKGKALIDANVPINFDLYNVINKNTFTRNIVFARTNCIITLNEKSTLSIQRNTITPDTTESFVIFLEKNNLNIQNDAFLNVTNNTFMTGKVEPQLQAALYVSEESYIQVNSIIKVQNNKSQNGAMAYQIYSKNTNGFMTSKGNFNSNNSRVVVYVETEDEKPKVFTDWKSSTVINTKNYINCIKPDSIYEDGISELLNETIVIKYTQHRHKLCGDLHNRCANHNEELLYYNIECYDITKTNKGRYYLNKNFALTNHIKLAGDLYLCLNGYTLDMGLCKFIGAGDYKLYICDCKGAGKIFTSNSENKSELFKNVKLELYGHDNKAKHIQIEGHKIYYANENTYIKAVNVDFVGKNQTGHKSDEIFYINTKNADTEFKDCSFTSFAGKSLIYANAQINFNGTCNIKENGFTDYVMNYASGHTMVLELQAQLYIENNLIKSDIENTAIINFNNAGRLFARKGATLFINKNLFATGKVTPKRQAAIYIPKNTFIHMNGEITVIDNISNNKIHTYQIYSERADGFMETIIDEEVEHTAFGKLWKTDSRFIKFKVYINSPDEIVTVFKNWKTDIIFNTSKYRDSIILDNKYDESKKVYLLNNNIVIGHMHKECGDNSCNHVGIADHRELVKYSSNYDASKTSGRYVLTKDITLDKTVNLTGDLYLCLNGHNLTVNGSINGNLKKLIICDCAKKGKVIAKNDTNYLFTDVNVELHNVTVESNLVYKSKANTNIKASNAKFNGKSVAVKSISFDINKDKSVFSNCTFNNIKSKTLINAKGRIAFYGINNIQGNEVTNNIINMENTYDMTIGGNSELKIYNNTITTGIQYPVIVNAPDSGNIIIDSQGVFSIENNRFKKGTVEPVISMGMYAPANTKIKLYIYAKFTVQGNNGDGKVCQVFSENANGLMSLAYDTQAKIKLFINSRLREPVVASGFVENSYSTINPETKFYPGSGIKLRKDDILSFFLLTKVKEVITIGEHK